MIIINNENDELILKHIVELSYDEGDDFSWVTKIGKIIFWNKKINKELYLDLNEFIKVDKDLYDDIYVHKSDYLKYQRKIKLDKLDKLIK